MRNLLNINKAIKLMENDYNNLSAMYEMVDIQYNQMYEDNETKMFIEGISIKNPFKGKIEAWKNRKNKSISDQEVNPNVDNPENDKIADEEIAKKKSIVKRIIDWFKKVFKSIKDKVKSFFKNRADKKQKVEISKEVLDDIKEIKDYYQKIKSPMKELSSGNIERAADTIENIPIPPSVENNENYGSNDNTVVIVTVSDRDKLIDDMNDISSDLEKNIDKTEANTNRTVDQAKQRGLKGLGIKLLNKVTSILSRYKKVILKIAKIIAIIIALTGVAFVGSRKYVETNPNTPAAKKINSILDKFGGYSVKVDDDFEDDDYDTLEDFEDDF